jgi:hypothetical protein
VKRLVISLVLLVTVLIGPGLSRAQASEDDDEFEGNVVATAVLASISAISIGLNLPAPPSARAAQMRGGFGVVMGLLEGAMGASQLSHSDRVERLGYFNMALGATAIGLGIWRYLTPPDQMVTVTPVMGTTGERGLRLAIAF